MNDCPLAMIFDMLIGKGEAVVWHSFIIVRQPNPLFGLNPEILCKVFLLIDFGSLGCTLSESAGCTPCNVERFEKFKMASKMAAVSDNSI